MIKKPQSLSKDENTALASGAVSTDLLEAAERVEGGEKSGLEKLEENAWAASYNPESFPFELYFLIWRELDPERKNDPRNIAKAIDGSLDAAQALHDAVLPGWIMGKIHQYNDPTNLWNVLIYKANSDWVSSAKCGTAPNAAAAWVAAILRAKASEKEK